MAIEDLVSLEGFIIVVKLDVAVGSTVKVEVCSEVAVVEDAVGKFDSFVIFEVAVIIVDLVMLGVTVDLLVITDIIVVNNVEVVASELALVTCRVVEVSFDVSGNVDVNSFDVEVICEDIFVTLVNFVISVVNIFGVVVFVVDDS